MMAENQQDIEELKKLKGHLYSLNSSISNLTSLGVQVSFRLNHGYPVKAEFIHIQSDPDHPATFEIADATKSTWLMPELMGNEKTT
jgi:hypothetical protein